MTVWDWWLFGPVLWQFVHKSHRKCTSGRLYETLDIVLMDQR